MTTTAYRVFVLDDQREVGHIVCRALEDQGIGTEYFSRARDFVRRFKARTPDLCIVDLGLPGEDGMETIRDIRAYHAVPVIILTGRGEIIDRVLGLELGADDYVVKPFDARELVARVKAVLRRSGQSHTASIDHGIDVARFGEWSFDFDSHTLTGPGDQTIRLSAAEAQLLLAFCRAPNRILSRDAILGTKGGGERAPFDRSIDIRISRLRQKIEKNPKKPQIVKTVYGAGYMFSTRVEWISRTD